MVRPSGEDPEHLFEYAQATVDADGRQEVVYLENLDDANVLGPPSRCPPRGLSEKHIMARTFAAPPLPVHGENSKFVKPRVLPPKRLPSPME